MHIFLSGGVEGTIQTKKKKEMENVDVTSRNCCTLVGFETPLSSTTTMAFNDGSLASLNYKFSAWSLELICAITLRPINGYLFSSSIIFHLVLGV